MQRSQGLDPTCSKSYDRYELDRALRGVSHNYNSQYLREIILIVQRRVIYNRARIFGMEVQTLRPKQMESAAIRVFTIFLT
jgi:hypothetical protein